MDQWRVSCYMSDKSEVSKTGISSLYLCFRQADFVNKRQRNAYFSPILSNYELIESPLK